MPKENEVQFTKLIIVEGNHERDFFSAWLNHLNLTEIQVLPIGGKTRLAENLRPLVKQPKFSQVESIIIVRDADDNPDGAFQSVCSALSGVNLPVPGSPEHYITQNNIKVAAVITPCNGRVGALEEILLETAETDPLYPAAIEFISSGTRTLDLTQARLAPLPHKQGKAKIHAFLATFEEPDKDPGKAALAGVWNFDHPALNPIREILEQM